MLFLSLALVFYLALFWVILHNPLHSVNLLSTVSDSEPVFSYLTCVTDSFILSSSHIIPHNTEFIFRFGASWTSELRTSVRTSLSERWIAWAMLVTWQCLVTHLVIFIYLSTVWAHWHPTGILILQYILIPMQQNIFCLTLDIFQFPVLRRDIKYCRKVKHGCTVTSYSPHQLYWLWLTPGSVIKRNKQATYRRLLIFALEMTVYNLVVSWMICPVLVLTLD